MRIIIVIAAFLLFIPATAQKYKQGITGKVFLEHAGELPSPDHPATPQSGVKRVVVIYEITTTDQAKQTGTFFSDISTRRVAEVPTRADGSFKVKLPPGDYSIFIQEGDALYANLFDNRNRINPVTVKPKQYAWLPITIEAQAGN